MVVHVVLPYAQLPVRHLALLWSDVDRSIFAIPRGDLVYPGSYDTSYAGVTDIWPAVTREDVTYLLAPEIRDFTGPPLAPEDVVAAWAGLRPLVAEPGKAAREMSRKDEI